MHVMLPYTLKHTRNVCPSIMAQAEKILVAGCERYVFIYYVFVSVCARMCVFVFVCVCVRACVSVRMRRFDKHSSCSTCCSCGGFAPVC